VYIDRDNASSLRQQSAVAS